MSRIDFIDLKAQRRRLGTRIEQAMARVVDHSGFILGPEVTELEKRLSAFCGARHTVTCANGTDALELVLMAEKIGPGDAVFVPAFTFVATAEVIPGTGATPYFVDVNEDDFCISPSSLEQAIAGAKAKGLKPRMVIPVDLFGQPADYDALLDIASKHDLVVLSDAAQSFGAELHGRKTGTFGKYTTTSFFPAKPLGCYGDGGAVFTDDDAQADLLRSLRFHGKGQDKYDNVRLGMNSRLDTLQAAILLEKLDIFADEIVARMRIAQRYNDLLRQTFSVPQLRQGATSVWAQYTLLLENRDAIAKACATEKIPTAIYYPIPLHLQQGYKQYPVVGNGLPVSEKLAQKVISLPMHPYLDEATQDRIVATILAVAK
ncbi:DegT/DnrJ/EryC1/StrS aminotransferase family protein [Ferrovibrio sp.]|uniref:DegT/DnrJ/EryC1/StrS family aminotransferase n=1 Tax=Ferrovibrio sp. TaxID=1917215 RepID=UPI0025BDE4A8|nr:DegT/DnrJ/EryC1/StrS family aminotransferase [Ferrovibrio sp.]